MQYYYNCLFLCITAVRKSFYICRVWCKFYTQNTFHSVNMTEFRWFMHFISTYGFWVPCKLIAIRMYMLIKFVIVYNLLLNKIPNVVTKKSLYVLFFILLYCQRLFLHSVRFEKGLTEMGIYWKNVLGWHKNIVTMQIILIILNNLVKRLW